ncbi:MAG: hypothetical protein DMG97_32690 [Acidobacteria bacterium]|nr:MAG: hypothetical protein DMG97_32690 [Acidobacteriota bacterium]PYV75295.1 MAG: hypothetical protein DMG96_17630 [Acidobacteriota bacterium]
MTLAPSRTLVCLLANQLYSLHRANVVMQSSGVRTSHAKFLWRRRTLMMPRLRNDFEMHSRQGAEGIPDASRLGLSYKGSFDCDESFASE